MLMLISASKKSEINYFLSFLNYQDKNSPLFMQRSEGGLSRNRDRNQSLAHSFCSPKAAEPQVLVRAACRGQN